MEKCVICGMPLDNENKSEEHIIHNALGGILEDDAIYCKKCNGMYGSNQDKAFIQIFAPFVDNFNMHKTRKTKGTSYTGVMYDKDGILYTATYRNGKIVKLENANSEYVNYEERKYRTLYYDFKFDNEAFKLGISKIAFNYAIHCGLDANCLEKVFDFSTKKLINKPVVIPFLPMTPFDLIMEMHPVERIFHVVRIFNYKNFLFAYIELFNTFQHYVLLSEKYDFEEQGSMDKSYGNIVETNAPLDEDLLKSLTPNDYKDADIIRNQYNINTDKLIEDLKKYHDYDNFNRFDQVKMLFTYIGKKAYEQIRKQSYIMEYKELVNHHYDSVDFKNEMSFTEDIESLTDFFQAYQYYTIYDDDCVDFETYKKFLPEGLAYPIAICNILNSGQQLRYYGHIKFYMLVSRLKENPNS